MERGEQDATVVTSITNYVVCVTSEPCTVQDFRPKHVAELKHLGRHLLHPAPRQGGGLEQSSGDWHQPSDMGCGRAKPWLNLPPQVTLNGLHSSGTDGNFWKSNKQKIKKFPALNNDVVGGCVTVPEAAGAPATWMIITASRAARALQGGGWTEWDACA